ncbi:type IV pilus biogenesis protein PilM [Plesiomonas sp. ZOR0011]|uniref:type IV pilus biogenesis protein PilM n=1 Tax=Plesiomonas sp. ZOR0011 TaxID=1339230 RepID=UPI0015A6F681|nr:type IV pilus biogenesis protein PilM [Plesiomonas sp. ZOR0011]
MNYWLLSIFIGVFIWSSIPLQNKSELRVEQSDLNQRAIQTVSYINEINDWRYANPSKKDGVIPDSSLGWVSVPGLHNVLEADRVYVYQDDKPGLMSALLAKTRGSALVGRVVSRRLLDSAGNDMQVNVPASIANGSLVYLN